MTKEQALALKDGDVIYLIDDSRLSMFSAHGVEHSPLLSHGLRRLTIGEPAHDMSGEPIHIFDVTGYLLHAAYGRNFAPKMFFTDPQLALDAFEGYMRKMAESLLDTLAKLDARVAEARALAVNSDRAHCVGYGKLRPNHITD